MFAMNDTRKAPHRSDGNSAIVLIIPAYEPNHALVELVRQVRNENDHGGVQLPIVVVDDGSSAGTREIFQAVEAVAGVTVLRHAVNLGKGAALKTAFNHALVNSGDMANIQSPTS